MVLLVVELPFFGVTSAAIPLYRSYLGPQHQRPYVFRHRVNLFSLSANSGAALAAAVVQPGAVGLLVPVVGAAALGEETVAGGYNSNDTRGSSGEVSGRRSTGPGCSDRGVVFESLDSRILEDALVSAMRRLGLGLKNRSRCVVEGRRSQCSKGCRRYASGPWCACPSA